MITNTNIVFILYGFLIVVSGIFLACLHTEEILKRHGDATWVLFCIMVAIGFVMLNMLVDIRVAIPP